jgi:signal transduction histidine kinase
MDARARVDRDRRALRPIGVALTVAVVLGSLQTDAGGRDVPIALALAAFAAAMAAILLWPDHGRIAGVVTMCAAAIALAWLQPHGPTEIAASVAVFLASARLELRLALALSAVTVAALVLATWLDTGASAAEVISGALLCVLLFAIAQFMDRAREGETRAEALVAELREARAAETRAAAVAERGRIAAELHDVLAHALSGLTVQLEGARMLAAREEASPALRETIERSGRLAREGLIEARRAVGALRGDDLPGLDRLPALVEDLRRDLGVDVTLRVDGTPRPLTADAGLALYRGAREALTNVARHATGAHALVVLLFEADRVVLTVTNTRGQTPQHKLNTDIPANGDNAIVKGSDPPVLAGDGGGFGLAGMRDRVAQAGGRVQAGRDGDGFRVELEFSQ